MDDTVTLKARIATLKTRIAETRVARTSYWSAIGGSLDERFVR